MRGYESIVGQNTLHDAYMYNGTLALQQDYDKYMGSGSFDSLCHLMDSMHNAEHNGNFPAADSAYTQISQELIEYAKKKRG